MTTRILIADAFTIFRTGVRDVLAKEPDFDVAEAADLDEVRASAARETLDVALIDLDLPPVGGVAALVELSRSRTTHSIVWSFEPTRETVLAAIRSGASGYLNKDISAQGLVRALRGVMQGEAPMPRDLTTLMIEALHGLDQRDRVRDQASLLSSRERQVLALVARGARNKDIANELTISEFTVKRHMQNILEKLELPSRHAAAGFYRTAFQDVFLPPGELA